MDKKVHSAYNIIMRRVGLKKFEAVPYTVHQCLKLPTNFSVGIMKGDQKVARECYHSSAKQEDLKEIKRKATTYQVDTFEPDEESEVKTLDPKEETEMVKVQIVETTKSIMLDDDKPERTTHVGTKLDPVLKQELVSFLRQRKHVFAWSHEDMPGTNPNFLCHELNVNKEIKPVKQRRRVFNPEKNQATQEEVKKLQKAAFINEVKYPDWLANVVMVKKKNNKWRMCIDFTDLNKACPKDHFPLSRIDQLVDATSGHELVLWMLILVIILSK